MIAMEYTNTGLNYLASSVMKMIKAKFSRFLNFFGAHSDHDVVKNVACVFCADYKPSCATCAFFTITHFKYIFIAVSNPLFLFFILRLLICSVRAHYRYVYFFYTRLRLSKLWQVYKLCSRQLISRTCLRRTYLFTGLERSERVFVTSTSIH